MRRRKYDEKETAYVNAWMYFSDRHRNRQQDMWSFTGCPRLEPCVCMKLENRQVETVHGDNGDLLPIELDQYKNLYPRAKSAQQLAKETAKRRKKNRNRKTNRKR